MEQTPSLGGHPVFRGFESLGVEVIDIAHMAGVDVKQVNAWRGGKQILPGPWAILLTRMLATWLRSVDVATERYAATPDGDAAGLGASMASRAENWLALAEEANKDLPEEAAIEADRLADARANHTGNAGHAA